MSANVAYTVQLDSDRGAEGSNSITCNDEAVLEGVLAALKTSGFYYNETTEAWVMPTYDD